LVIDEDRERGIRVILNFGAAAEALVRAVTESR
jgi:hypothetical protein